MLNCAVHTETLELSQSSHRLSATAAIAGFLVYICNKMVPPFSDKFQTARFWYFLGVYNFVWIFLNSTLLC